MTRKQAIATAQARVAMQPQGNQWVVYTWSSKYKATQASHSMDFWHAQSVVWENRVNIALELLGISDEAANTAAYNAAHSGEDWRKAVRRLADWYANGQPSIKAARDAQINSITS